MQQGQKKFFFNLLVGFLILICLYVPRKKNTWIIFLLLYFYFNKLCVCCGEQGGCWAFALNTWRIFPCPSDFPCCCISPSPSSPAWQSVHHLEHRVARQEGDVTNPAPAPKDFQQEAMCHLHSRLIGQSKPHDSAQYRSWKIDTPLLYPEGRESDSDGNQWIATDKSPQRDSFVLVSRRFGKLVLINIFFFFFWCCGP